jgi:hypothetical protein
VERIIAEELQRSGWSERDLPIRRMMDQAELSIGARLWRETTLPLNAFAVRLGIGNPKYAKGKLHAFMRQTLGGADLGHVRVG